jgi:hypothetical protein
MTNAVQASNFSVPGSPLRARRGSLQDSTHIHLSTIQRVQSLSFPKNPITPTGGTPNPTSLMRPSTSSNSKSGWLSPEIAQGRATPDSGFSQNPTNRTEKTSSFTPLLPPFKSNTSKPGWLSPEMAPGRTTPDSGFSQFSTPTIPDNENRLKAMEQKIDDLTIQLAALNKQEEVSKCRQYYKVAVRVAFLGLTIAALVKEIHDMKQELTDIKETPCFNNSDAFTEDESSANHMTWFFGVSLVTLALSEVADKAYNICVKPLLSKKAGRVSPLPAHIKAVHVSPAVDG